MKLQKTDFGYQSPCGIFQFIKCHVASSRNGCWKTAWRLTHHGKLISDPFEESLTDCKEIAEEIISDEIEEQIEKLKQEHSEKQK